MKEDTPIKAARKQSGKTQAQVAEELKIAQCMYQRYEYGKQVPNAKLGNRIAKALGTTSEKLWGYWLVVFYRRFGVKGKGIFGEGR